MKGSTRVRSIVLLALLVGGVVSALVGTLFSVVGGLLPSEGAPLFLAVFSIPAELGGCVVNLGTELIGAGITYVLLERVIGLREGREAEKAAIEAEKKELIAQMDSSVRDVAVAAVEKLGRRGWLRDGSLQRVFLGGANLQGAFLGLADLQNARLWDVNLQEANLSEAKLQGATLVAVNLKWAVLEYVKLCEANIDSTNLERADLRDANLRGARLLGVHLVHANLTGADLQGVTLTHVVLQDTALPDGAKWTPDTDMSRFTGPDHPDFWRSDDPRSPAYRGSE